MGGGTAKENPATGDAPYLGAMTAPAPQALPATTPRSTNGLAIASLIVSLTVPGVGGLLAVIFGHIALKQVRQCGDAGRRLAIAGLVIGYTSIGLVVLLAAVAGLGSLVRQSF